MHEAGSFLTETAQDVNCVSMESWQAHGTKVAAVVSEGFPEEASQGVEWRGFLT